MTELSITLDPELLLAGHHAARRFDLTISPWAMQEIYLAMKAKEQSLSTLTIRQCALPHCGDDATGYSDYCRDHRILGPALGDDVERVWDALKNRCCADASKAKRCVMVSREDLAAAINALGRG